MVTGAADVVWTTTGSSDVLEMTGAAAWEVLETTATGVVDAGLDVVEETAAAFVDEDVLEEPKLLDAVVDAPPLISTSLTRTTSPSTLVILTSTVVVPVPLDISKKLYVWRVAVSQVDPPSVLTSRLETALLALTTCIENQYADTPSLLWTWRADVIGQSTKSHKTSMTPVVGFARSAKALGNRSR